MRTPDIEIKDSPRHNAEFLPTHLLLIREGGEQSWKDGNNTLTIAPGVPEPTADIERFRAGFSLRLIEDGVCAPCNKHGQIVTRSIPSLPPLTGEEDAEAESVPVLPAEDEEEG